MPIRQFQAQRMHAPRDFQMIRPEPVCVEIGAGKGKHALLFSTQEPEKQLIAIERTREKYLAMQKQHVLEGQKFTAHSCRCDALGRACINACTS